MTATSQAVASYGISGSIPVPPVPRSGLVIPFPLIEANSIMRRWTTGGTTPVPTAVLGFYGDGYLENGTSSGTTVLLSYPSWYAGSYMAPHNTYWIKVTQVSGDAVAGSAVGVWLPVVDDSTQYNWGYSLPGSVIAEKTGVIDIDLSTSVTGTPVVSYAHGVPLHCQVVAESTPQVIIANSNHQYSIGCSSTGTNARGYLGFSEAGYVFRNDVQSGNYGDIGRRATSLTDFARPFDPNLAGTKYYVRCTVLSGSLTSGAVGTWALGGIWIKGPATTGADSCELLFEVSTTASFAGLVAAYNWTLGYQHV